MRVLLVNRFFGGNQVPTGRMLADVAGELGDLGCEVVVLTGDHEYTRHPAEVQLSSRVQVRRVCTGRSRNRLLNWAVFGIQAVVLIPLMRWERCVILTDPPFMILASRLAKVLGRERRIFWWTMDLYPEALVADRMISPRGICNSVLRQFNEFGLRGLTGVITLGIRQKERLELYRQWSRKPGFCTVIPPWDNRNISPRDKKKNELVQHFGWQKRRVVLYAGNLGHGHTYKDLLEAAMILEKQEQNWVFAFFCQGEGRTNLEKEGKSLPNVLVHDYVAPELTSALLYAATIHVITMQDGWEGVVVPSKLYGILYTRAPVLFIGPDDSDTAREIKELGLGVVLPNGCGGNKVIDALETLSLSRLRQTPPEHRQGARATAAFIAKED